MSGGSLSRMSKWCLNTNITPRVANGIENTILLNTVIHTDPSFEGVRVVKMRSIR